MGRYSQTHSIWPCLDSKDVYRDTFFCIHDLFYILYDLYFWFLKNILNDKPQKFQLQFLSTNFQSLKFEVESNSLLFCNFWKVFNRKKKSANHFSQLNTHQIGQNDEIFIWSQKQGNLLFWNIHYLKTHLILKCLKWTINFFSIWKIIRFKFNFKIKIKGILKN